MVSPAWDISVKLHNNYEILIFVRVCARAYVCVCVHTYVWAGAHESVWQMSIENRGQPWLSKALIQSVWCFQPQRLLQCSQRTN